MDVSAARICAGVRSKGPIIARNVIGKREIQPVS